MSLLDKKSVKVEGIREFFWAPFKIDDSNYQNMISYWTPEVGNQPARITLMTVPDKGIVRTKNLFGVNEVCSFLSHSFSNHFPSSHVLTNPTVLSLLAP